MNIVVLAGGLSVERAVSLSSGSMVCAALRRSGHNAVLVDVFFGPGDLPDPITEYFDIVDDAGAVRVDRQAPDIAAVRRQRGDSGLGDIGKNVIELCRAADIVYMGLHGDDGENGKMQAFFDVLGVRYTGSGYLGSALAMHKGVSKQLFHQCGIPTPEGWIFQRGEAYTAGEFGYPCVVKPCSGGSSIGVHLPQDADAFKEAMESAFRYDSEVLVEKYIQGREFSVGILGGEALPAIEIIPKDGFYDYEHKYQPGWTEEVCPADVDDGIARRLAEMARAAFGALRIDVYARGEFILDAEGNIYCLEMNTLPGMTPTSLLPQEAAAAGISYDALCEKIIRLSLERYKR